MEKKYYLSSKPIDSSQDWEKRPQKEIYTSFKEICDIAKREAKNGNHTVRISSSKGYTSNGLYFN